jgi:1,4-dihydroxy-2-naphthoate octaprenyltransferase
MVVLALAAPHPWVLIALLAAPFSVPPTQKVIQGAKGRDLIPVLGMTARLQIVYGVLLAVGLAL